MSPKKIILLCCAGLMLSCQEVKQTPKPANLIPEKKMVNVLVDMARVNALIQRSKSQYRKRDVKAQHLIFEKYGIDSLQWVDSNKYYAEQFNVNLRIYDSVKAILNRKKDSLEALVKAENDKEAARIAAEKKTTEPKEK